MVERARRDSGRSHHPKRPIVLLGCIICSRKPPICSQRKPDHRRSCATRADLAHCAQLPRIRFAYSLSLRPRCLAIDCCNDWRPDHSRTASDCLKAATAVVAALGRSSLAVRKLLGVAHDNTASDCREAATAVVAALSCGSLAGRKLLGVVDDRTASDCCTVRSDRVSERACTASSARTCCRRRSTTQP